MESRPTQNSETAITEKCVDRNEKEDDEEGNFFSNDELEEYKKVHEVLLKFSTAKPKNKSDLRKSLFNIIASSTRRLAFLEDATNQETTGTRTKNTKSNQQLNSDEYEKFSNPEDKIIPRKIKGHLGQKKDEKDEQIPQVTIQRIICNNKPKDTVLYENDDCRMNNKTSNTTSSQYSPVLQENASQTIIKKEEIHDTQLNNKIQIEFECKNVKPSIISITPQKSNTRIEHQPNRQNEKISPLKSMLRSQKFKKLKVCPKKFMKISNLKIYKKTDCNIHSCDICGKKFMQKHKLEIHTEVVHNGRIHHKCDRCGKTYATQFILDRHINSIHNSVTHTCDACGKSFTRKDSLKDHIEFKHKGVTDSCYICEKKFADKRYLKIHIDFVHNGQKSHNCDICGKTFGKSGHLKLHIDSVHKGVKHPCDLCQKVFTQQGSLKIHKDSVHYSITHPCNLCKKVFTQKTHLKRHKDSVHNGITHPCDLCNQSFARKRSLKRHIDEVHIGKIRNR